MELVRILIDFMCIVAVIVITIDRIRWSTAYKEATNRIMEAKDETIKTLKDQRDYLLQLNTGNFVESIIVREKYLMDRVQKLESDEGKPQLVEEIKNIKLSAVKTSTAINASLDSITATGTFAGILNLRKEQEGGGYRTSDILKMKLDGSKEFEIPETEDEETPIQRALKPDKTNED